MSVSFDAIMIMGISPKDKIKSKCFWLSDIENDDVGINSLGKAGSSLCHKKVMEKRWMVDDNGIGSTGLGISGLRGIGSNLRCKRRL